MITTEFKTEMAAWGELEARKEEIEAEQKELEVEKQPGYNYYGADKCYMGNDDLVKGVEIARGLLDLIDDMLPEVDPEVYDFVIQSPAYHNALSFRLTSIVKDNAKQE